jgi:hypothetical protein
MGGAGRFAGGQSDLGRAVVFAEIATPDTKESAYEKIALFTRVIEQIREHYVDREKTSYKD